MFCSRGSCFHLENIRKPSIFTYSTDVDRTAQAEITRGKLSQRTPVTAAAAAPPPDVRAAPRPARGSGSRCCGKPRGPAPTAALLAHCGRSRQPKETLTAGAPADGAPPAGGAKRSARNARRPEPRGLQDGAHRAAAPPRRVPPLPRPRANAGPASQHRPGRRRASRGGRTRTGPGPLPAPPSPSRARPPGPEPLRSPQPQPGGPGRLPAG